HEMTSILQLAKAADSETRLQLENLRLSGALWNSVVGAATPGAHDQGPQAYCPAHVPARRVRLEGRRRRQRRELDRLERRPDVHAVHGDRAPVVAAAPRDRAPREWQAGHR